MRVSVQVCSEWAGAFMSPGGVLEVMQAVLWREIRMTAEILQIGGDLRRNALQIRSEVLPCA
jgi:hypothetical protein